MQSNRDWTRSELVTFARAILGLGVMAVAFVIVIYGNITNNAGIPDLLVPFLLPAIPVCLFAGAGIVRSAYRDATRPR